ncbi:guanylate kinase [Candidatus Marinamargulisbacteria bacterium SCGC AAA071-K20]|nr:guanylate kinase [Candidatus Marinamargulisbacteria bacterium SCGC AAA071-K20]
MISLAQTGNVLYTYVFAMVKTSKIKGNIVILSGPSGVGKGTIINGVLKKIASMRVAISATTRQPRREEANRKNYYFMSDYEFDEKIESDSFVEWCNVLNKRYGTLKSEIEDTINEGKDIILEIDTQGAQKIKAKMPDSILVFIAPPTMKDLEARLINRQTEQEIDIKNRLDKAKLEISEIDKYDFVVVNKEINKAIDSIVKILTKSCKEH